MKKEYPRWACADCGKEHGKRFPRISTWHYGKCDVCEENRSVTEVRDYGHFPYWFKEMVKK